MTNEERATLVEGVRRLAQQTMRNWGPHTNPGLLDSVIVVYDWGSKAAKGGSYHHSQRTLWLNMNLLQSDDDQFRTVVIHEFCHAMVGPGVGHGPVWKRAMVTMGLPPKRCHSISLTDKLPGRWTTVQCTNGHSLEVSYKRVAQINRGVVITHRCGGQVLKPAK